MNIAGRGRFRRVEIGVGVDLADYQGPHSPVAHRGIPRIAGGEHDVVIGRDADDPHRDCLRRLGWYRRRGCCDRRDRPARGCGDSATDDVSVDASDQRDRAEAHL